MPANSPSWFPPGQPWTSWSRFSPPERRRLSSRAWCCNLQRSAGIFLEQIVDALAFRLEAVQVVILQGAAARQAHPHRINLSAVDDYLVVQVRTGRQTSIADEADDLALADPRTGLHAFGNRALVTVGGLIAVGVADDRLCRSPGPSDFSTVPLPAAMIGVPRGAAQSTPVASG